MKLLSWINIGFPELLEQRLWSIVCGVFPFSYMKIVQPGKVDLPVATALSPACLVNVGINTE